MSQSEHATGALEHNYSGETPAGSSGIPVDQRERGESEPGQGAASPCTDVQVLEGHTVVAPRPSLRHRWNGERMPERMRARIQTGVLLRRLHKISKGRISGTPAQLAVQVQAAKVLLAKSLPDIQNVTISGDGDAPLVILTRME